MNRQWRWGFVVASLLTAAACTEDKAEGMDAGADRDAGPSGATIVSDDGLATLYVPDGALPEGVTREMISVTALDPADLEFDDGRDPPGRIFAAYRLEPEGTVFALPVTLSVQTSLDPTTGAISVWHLSSESFESPEPSATLDASGTRIEIVSVDLEHFSSSIFVQSDAFLRSTRLQPMPDTLDLGAISVGQMFAVLAETLVNRESGEMIAPDVAHLDTVRMDTVLVSWGADQPYSVSFVFRAYSEVLSFVPAEDHLGSYEGTDELARTVKTLRCDRAGPFFVQLEVHVHTSPVLVMRRGGSEETWFEFYGFQQLEGRCVEGVDAGPAPPPDAGSGTSCMHDHECGAGQFCDVWGDMLCHDDSSSLSCGTDTDCEGTAHPVCVDAADGTQRCADCRAVTDCASIYAACVGNRCVECDVDADCAATTGICGPGKTCVECASPTDCGAYPGRPNCTSDGRCVQCASDAECTGVLPHCGTDGTCTECSDDAHCAAPLPICRNGRCNRCQSSTDCPSNALPSCQHSGCNRCTSDFSCSGSYTCETGAFIGRICTTGCTADGDCDAARGEICIGSQCRQCMVDTDCPAAAPHCDAGNCYECLVAADCPSPLICDTGNGRCIPCAVSADCTSPGLPRCEFNACAGCNSDADCTRFAGTVCNTIDGSCEAP